MPILKLLTKPNPRLKIKSRPVTVFGKSLKKTVDDIVETIHKENGVGVGSIQVGIAKQIIVVDLGDNDDTVRQEGFYPLALINPEIIYYSEELIEAPEGCLSVPGVQISVKRAKHIKLKYQDLDGEHKTMEASNWLARVILHEFDHICGRCCLGLD